MKSMFGLLALVCMTSISYAASFDCAKASSKMEKAICQNPTLSTQDESLANAYREAKARLSPAAVKQLIRGQVSWLRFQSTACFLDYNAAPETPARAADCLSQAYAQRIALLKTAGNHIGPFKTYPMSEYVIKVSQAEKSVYTLQRDYVQIDDASAFGDELNAFLGSRQTFPVDLTRGSDTYHDTVALAGSDWLVRTQSYDSFTGAHPNSGRMCNVYSLKHRRILLLSDVFTSEAWKQVAIRETKTHFENLARKDKDFSMDMVLDYSTFEDPISNPWPFCFNATTIEFSGFMPHVARNFDFVELKWTQFAKLLTREAVEQIAQMQTRR